MSAGRVACCRDVKDYDERKESGTPLQMVRTSSGIPSRKSTRYCAVYYLSKFVFNTRCPISSSSSGRIASPFVRDKKIGSKM